MESKDFLEPLDARGAIYMLRRLMDEYPEEAARVRDELYMLYHALRKHLGLGETQ